ncbi:hypothetical protein CASFOL_032359 [Castilleja foliolosa]|uniref:Uncharacterized protein n=1 Tax=Castilleja foliolosa TaxID=1961234 RepID=A0ABD3C180_9LAMI
MLAVLHTVGSIVKTPLKATTKILVTRFAVKAGKQPMLRTITIKCGQIGHIFTTNKKRFMNGYSLDCNVRPLSDKEVVRKAADLSAKLFLFKVGLLVLYYKKTMHEKDLKQKREEFESLKKQVEKLIGDVKSLKGLKGDIEVLRGETEMKLRLLRSDMEVLIRR